MPFINITADNIDQEHICCAISDKKHQAGVDAKKAWLKQRLNEGHVFRKLRAQGKVLIEYASLETAWVPVQGNNYLYIYCFWVSGSFKGQGYGKALLDYCIKDAKAQNKSGICVLSAKKKTPYLTDKAFMERHGFETVDSVGNGYELLALSFDGTKPRFTELAKTMQIDDKALTIYYSLQCPFIPNCLQQVTVYCQTNNIPLHTQCVDTLSAAKALPCVMNNWAVFKDGQFQSLMLLNEGGVKKLLV